jgi:hypothetical protein
MPEEPARTDHLLLAESEVKKIDLTLVDAILASKPGPFEPPRLRLMRAQRFVLDRDASHYFQKLVHDLGPLLLAQHAFARPPYEQTWVEFDCDAYFADTWGLAPEERDARIGFLFDGNAVHCWSNTQAHPVPECGPVSYLMHTPVTYEEEPANAQAFHVSRLVWRHHLIGGIGKTAGDPWWMSDEATEICRSHRVVVAPGWAEFIGDMPPIRIAEFLRLTAGTFKQMLTLALLLSRSSHRYWTISEQPRGRAIVAGKPRVLVPYNRVTMHLKEEVAMARFQSDLRSGVHRRHHSVRGHWAQSRRFIGCDHAWIERDEDHFDCGLCKAKRWWRQEHHRGDISKGSVSKTYEVTE